MLGYQSASFLIVSSSYWQKKVMGRLWQKQMENSQSKKLPLFFLYLVQTCCLLLATKAWRLLGPKARHHLPLPRLLLTWRTPVSFPGGQMAGAG